MFLPFLAPVLVIGVLVLVHEMGHFVVAKWRGIRVETFSIGFGPAIAGFRRGDTFYKISWIPFGGYVKMSGEDPEEDEAGRDEPWRFHRKSVADRAAVILAGPAANFVLAALVYSLIFYAYGADWIETTVVGFVLPGTAAEEAGVLPGDRVVRVGGDPVGDWVEMAGRIGKREDGPLLLTVEREGTERTISLKPREGEPVGIAPEYDTRVGAVSPEGPAGAAGLARGDRILAVDGERVRTWREMRGRIEAAPGRELEILYERAGTENRVRITPDPVEETGPDGTIRTVGKLQIGEYVDKKRLGPIGAFAEGARQTWWVTENVFVFLQRLFTGGVSRDMVGGPVSIFNLSRESAKRGLDTLLTLLAFLSVELGILNLFPIPVLDGGHMVFLGIEAVRRKPLALKHRLIAQQVGLLVILTMMVTVTFFDVGRLFD
ncbi:MAG: RIP metalloprotease RseP [Candidatus Eisenbacteria bacterium]|nr:RIP metalloprotease RseP [Candidatus Eisenbacteria bacterium]